MEPAAIWIPNGLTVYWGSTCLTFRELYMFNKILPPLTVILVHLFKPIVNSPTSGSILVRLIGLLPFFALVPVLPHVYFFGKNQIVGPKDSHG